MLSLMKSAISDENIAKKIAFDLERFGYSVSTVRFITRQRASQLFKEFPLQDALMSAVNEMNASPIVTPQVETFNFTLDFELLRHRYFDGLWGEIEVNHIFTCYWDFIVYCSLLIKLQNPSGVRLDASKHNTICMEVQKLYKKKTPMFPTPYSRVCEKIRTLSFKNPHSSKHF